MAENFKTLEELVQELEDEGRDLGRVLVSEKHVLVPREASETDDEEG